MKKIISVILAVSIFAVAFVGCGGTQADSVTKDYTTNGKETKLVADETATGELTVSWCGSNFVPDGNPYVKSIEIFKELYPNVDVEFEFLDISKFPGKEEMEMENYYKQLQTKIMAGSSADVFELTGKDVDVDKIIRSGSLADMYEYFENDEYFNVDDYNQIILKSGQYNGGQYVIPRVYRIPFFMTTKEIAETIGYDEVKKLDYFETWDFLLKMNNEHRNEFSGEKLIGNMAMPDMFPYISGIDFIDMQGRKANFETTEFKKAVEKQKEILRIYPYARLFTSGAYLGVNELKRKQMAMWSFNYGGINSILQNMRLLGIEDAVIIPFRDINKKLQASTMNNVAVSSSSKNKENAYKFIKILINEEVSGRYDENLGAIDYYIPISNVATKKLLEQSMQDEMMLHADDTDYEYGKTTGASEEFVDGYLSLINDIDGVFTSSPAMQKIQDAFQPYFDDKVSYEECLKNATESLDIYLSE